MTPRSGHHSFDHGRGVPTHGHSWEAGLARHATCRTGNRFCYGLVDLAMAPGTPPASWLAGTTVGRATGKHKAAAKKFVGLE
ncbi:hypothetical protein NL676_034498 [Syzygium grande]|nr:hypothetical protein NL676_034498 [Syzygium grande]